MRKRLTIITLLIFIVTLFGQAAALAEFPKDAYKEKVGYGEEQLKALINEHKIYDIRTNEQGPQGYGFTHAYERLRPIEENPLAGFSLTVNGKDTYEALQGSNLDKLPVFVEINSTDKVDIKCTASTALTQGDRHSNRYHNRDYDTDPSWSFYCVETSGMDPQYLIWPDEGKTRVDYPIENERYCPKWSTGCTIDKLEEAISRAQKWGRDCYVEFCPQ